MKKAAGSVLSRIAAAAAVAIVVATAGRALANHHGAIIGACFSPNGKVKLAHAVGECEANATLASWNAQGPAGPQGARGEAGPSGVASHFVVHHTAAFGPAMENPPVDYTYTMNAQCPADYRVVGGGGQIIQGQAAGIVMTSSHPDTLANDLPQMRRWAVSWRTVDGSPFPVDLVSFARVFAVCVEVD